MTDFVIGTAQFGMNYGIANSVGQPSAYTVNKIIEYATEHEVFYYDTAIAYGDSEQVLGRAFDELGVCQRVKVFTKIPKLKESSSPESIVDSVSRSIERLRVEKIFGILLHNELDHLYLKELIKLKGRGLCEYVGTSTGHDASFNRNLIRNQNLDLIQLPANLLDRRNLIPEIIENQEGKKIAVRSVYLQGLFSMTSRVLSGFHKTLGPLLERLHRVAENSEMSVHEMALRYILSYSPNYVVVGVESIQQFQSNLTWFKKGALEKKVVDQINTISYDLDFKLITPHQWPR